MEVETLIVTWVQCQRGVDYIPMQISGRDNGSCSVIVDEATETAQRMLRSCAWTSLPKWCWNSTQRRHCMLRERIHLPKLTPMLPVPSKTPTKYDCWPIMAVIPNYLSFVLDSAKFWIFSQVLEGNRSFCLLVFPTCLNIHKCFLPPFPVRICTAVGSIHLHNHSALVSLDLSDSIHAQYHTTVMVFHTAFKFILEIILELLLLYDQISIRWVPSPMKYY